MTHVEDPLTGLAMWSTWQNKVIAALPKFAANPWYLEQDSLSPDHVNEVAKGLQTFCDLAGRGRDLAHGARAFSTDIGIVTRAWVDANIEIGFLWRHLDFATSINILDIGAGYGRLAVMLAPMVNSYTCVDPVPISVELCRSYTQQYVPSVRVLDVPGLRHAMMDDAFRPTLAINIHSWNECSSDQILAWLDVLDTLQVPWLFTVSHGYNADGSSYHTWGGTLSNFKPLLLERYDLVAEESIGLGRHPHALWHRRAA